MEAQEEQPVTPQLSLSDVIADLQGFGVEDFEEILTMHCGGKTVTLRIANLTTEEERIALLAAEDSKGYEWMQNIRIEILSRSISYVNGVNLRTLTGRQRLVVDPKDKVEKDIQVVLRETLRSWGQEHVMILWRVLMVHSQSIEDRLFESFPEAAVMTAVQRRLEARAAEEIENSLKSAIQERANALLTDEDSEEA
jgi:hypothetical protein